jgi:hypothetical protein
MLLSGLTLMDKYLPHSTLADMNATHLDIERIRLAANIRKKEILDAADEVAYIAKLMYDYGNIWEYERLTNASGILSQLAEGK